MPKRVDANQREIVKALRDYGCSVLIMSDLGKGKPDLLVGWGGLNLLVELKDGKKHLSAQKLTEHEEKFHNEWKGQVCIIRSIREALLLIDLASVSQNL